MSTELPVVFRGSPLPNGWTGTPQEFLDAIVARLSIEAQSDISFFVSGAVAPTSDEGPWIKNGITWYVWDTVTGAYIPQVIEFESLKYIASSVAPDQNKYTFWIKLDGSGQATSIQYYYSGAWHDIYEGVLALYYTKSEVDAFFAPTVAGKKQIDWTNVINKPANGTASFRAISGSSQTQVFAGAGTISTDLVFGSETFDPSGVFSSSTFTAPSDGIYLFELSVNLEVTAGTPTGNTSIASIRVNGSDYDSDVTQDTTLSDKILKVTSLINMTVGQTVTARVETTISGGSGTWSIQSGNNTHLQGYKIF